MVVMIESQDVAAHGAETLPIAEASAQTIRLSALGQWTPCQSVSG
jgi:hypothetical protein